MSKKRLNGICFTVITSALCGCSTVNETGRHRVLLLSEKQEHNMGTDAYREIIADETLSTDAQMTAIVVRVGQRIAAVADRPDFEWEFNLLESKTVNAFCLPGGKIAIYTGILPVMMNEAGMAAVMGHEVAHATCRHGNERISQKLSLKVITKILSTGLGQVAPEFQGPAMEAFGYGTTYGVVLPFSREHESEADRVGLIYAARAGYDPREAARFWQRMADQSDSHTPEFLSTHPSEKHRIAKLEEHMAEAMQIYMSAPQQHGLGESLIPTNVPDITEVPTVTDSTTEPDPQQQALTAQLAADEAEAIAIQNEAVQLQAECKALEERARRNPTDPNLTKQSEELQRRAQALQARARALTTQPS